MSRSRRAVALGRRLAVPAVLALALALAACGDDDGGPAASSPAALAVPGAVDLAPVCPERVVIQTDWNPEMEHGALYQLLGDPYTVDADRKRVRGPLVAGGEPTGVEVEIRSGGPAIGYQDVGAQMAQDRAIHLGYVSTDEAVKLWDTIRTRAVVAPLEVNPQVIMWDPATYPDVRTIADLGEAGVRILVRETVSYLGYLVRSGQVDAGQLDGSYQGDPAAFVAAGGRIAQQGFASAEPYVLEHEIPEWGRPVAFQLVHDAGWETYPQPLVVAADRLEELRPCLHRLVPVVQQAVVDLVADPSRVERIVLELVERYDTGWVYSPGVADHAMRTMVELGVIGNGPDATVGNFDEGRLARFLPEALAVFREEDPSLPELAPEDIATNEFIDPSIGLPG